MSDVHGKFDTCSVAATEAGKFLDKNSRDRPKTSVRLLDSAADFSLQVRIVSCFNAHEPPENTFQPRNRFSGKADVHHFIDFFIDHQITYIGS
jgi:hypothetical protein